MKRDFWYLLAVCFFFFLLRLPSLIEPYWYGDEGIYHVIGSALQDGRILYKDIWDNKPPLLYVMYALFGPDQFSVRLASLIFGIGAVIALFYLAKKLFRDSRKQFHISALVTCIFAFFFSLPLLEGNIANAENFMLFPIIVAAYLIISQSYFLAGIILGVALLFKIVAVFDFGAFFVFTLLAFIPIAGTTRHAVFLYRKLIAPLSLLLLGFILPLGIAVVYFLSHNALDAFFEATLFQNVGYVGYANKLFITQGLLILKVAFLFTAVVLIAVKRRALSHTAVFVLLWFVFSLFNVFFSQRPYTHYTLVLLPSLSLAAGATFFAYKGRKVIVVVLAVAVFLTVSHFKLYRFQTTIAYYQNFLAFTTNKKTVQDYLAFFDSDTPRDYQVADYIRTHTKREDIVFVWGNSAQIYTLSHKLPPGKYTVAYHVASTKARNETEHMMQRVKPRYVVVLPDTSLPFYLTDYSQKLTIRDTQIYERIL